MQVHTNPYQFPTTYSKTNAKTRKDTNHSSANNRDGKTRKRKISDTTTSPAIGAQVETKQRKTFYQEYPHPRQEDQSIIDYFLILIF